MVIDYLIMAKKSVQVQVADSDLALLLRDSSTIYEIRPKMDSKSRRIKLTIVACVLFVVVGIFYFGYYCQGTVCALSRNPNFVSFRPLYDDRFQGPLYPHDRSVKRAGFSYDEVIHENFSFDMNQQDVIVFLHIQKTGGTSFGKHLVKDLDLERPCSCQRKHKRCNCFRPNRKENWLFSRYSTGWKCGLHADWTELTNCVDSKLDDIEGESVKRRYLYIALLREPVARYLSEYRHVQRGATWNGSRHWCGGREATASELPPCYRGNTWHGVQLDEFTSCPFNLAVNRQTRMMADLALVGCYNMSYMPPAERDRVLLASAKRNLVAMAFFGLTEYQKIAQYVFEETFNLRFLVAFEQSNSTMSSQTLARLRPDQLTLIRRLNALDLELYEFARALMFKRFNQLKAKDPDFEERFAHLGEIPGKGGTLNEKPASSSSSSTKKAPATHGR